MRTTLRYVLLLAACFFIGSSELYALIYPVLNTNNSGAGSLRDAIDEANANPGVDEIRFFIPGNGPHTINITSALPTITEGIIIDGRTQQGYTGSNPVIIISGNSTSYNGLTLTTANCEIYGLFIKGFSRGIEITGDTTEAFVISENILSSNSNIGLYISAAQGGIISHNKIGTDSTGLVDLGNSSDGIHINILSRDVIFTDNLISGNSGEGIYIVNPKRAYFIRNTIGLNQSGTSVIANGDDGIYIHYASDSIHIEENQISGNGDFGAYIRTGGSIVAIYNIIGTNILGTLDFGNIDDGMILYGNKIIKVNHNLVSGNNRYGVVIGTYSSSNSSNHQVEFLHNIIGTDSSHTISIGNSYGGASIYSPNQIIIRNNWLANNGYEGIYTSGSNQTVIEDNYMINNGSEGIEAASSSDLMISDNFIYNNGYQGIFLRAGVSLSLIENNTISANSYEGIYIDRADNITIRNNMIGTDSLGILDQGNGRDGIELYSSSSSDKVNNINILDNTISGNIGRGILIGGQSNGCMIQGNMIGVNTNGTQAIPNDNIGIQVYGNIPNIVIGGTNLGEGNIISGNGASGIMINTPNRSSPGGAGCIIIGNRIGTDASGLTAIANSHSGISTIVHRAGLTIQENLISGNDSSGISAYWGTSHTSIQDNIIGLDINGFPLGNATDGIKLFNNITNTGHSDYDIDNNEISNGNIIAYNGRYGISVYSIGGGNYDNTFQGNTIYCNSNGGIKFLGTIAVQDGISKPVLTHTICQTTTSSATITGTAPANSTVDVYRDDYLETCAPTQARIYIGTATASSSGSWSLTATLPDCRITAMATVGGSSSELSSSRRLITTPVVAQITPSDTISLCQSDSLILMANTNPNYGFDYQWVKDQLLLPFDTAVSYTIYNPGEVWLRVTGECGLAWDTLTITNTSAAATVPSISLQQTGLVSTPAISYQWYYNGGLISGASGQTFAPSNTGTYTVSTLDSAGCSATSTPFTYTAPFYDIGLVSISEPNNVICADDNQLVRVSYQNNSNDTLNFSIDSLVLSLAITGSINQNFQSVIHSGTLAPNQTQSIVLTTQADFSTVGNYTLSVNSSFSNDQQANNNSLTAQVTASVGPTVSAVVNQNVPCFGGNNGVATIQVSGGITPYTYLWESGNTAATDSNLTAGFNTFYVSDSTGCTITDSVSLTEPTELVLTAYDITPTCYQDSTGRVTLEVTGGVTPYTFPWSPNGQNPFTIVDFEGGSYTMVVADANGCIATIGFTVPEATPLVMQTTIVDDVCGTGSGSITANISGSIPPYTYVWGGGDSTAQLSNLSAGNHTLTVLDSINCFVRDTALAVGDICQPPSASFTLSADSICSANSLSITSQNQYGVDQLWTFVGGIPSSSTLAEPPSVLYQTAGKYEIRYTIMNPVDTLVYTDSITVIDCVPTDANFTASGTSVCEGGTISFSHIGTVSGHANYYWSFVGGNPSTSTSPTPNVSYNLTGQYDVSLIVSDLSGVDTVDLSSYISVDTCGTQVPPNWLNPSTGFDHTIIIDASSFTSDVLGSPLAIGDYIGVFYTHNGQEHCGGFVQWTGVNAALSAAGNSLTAPNKNGFDIGESFKWKVWSVTNQQELDAAATYSPTNFLFTHQGNYDDDGISGLATLTSSLTQMIPLNMGWNMISSYLIPDSTALESVTRDISFNIILFKDYQGAIYQPTFMINNIGAWDSTQGYRIKMNVADTLIITGLRVPSSTLLNLSVGWSIVPYLNDFPMNADTVFAGIQSDISLLKNNDGQSYIPAFNINQIGDMLPGQGYKIKMLNSVSFGYPNRIAPWAYQVSYQPQQNPSHYILDLNTGNNATLVFSEAALNEVMEEGDEIGIFTSNGTLAGSGVYEGHHLAITVWGDELSTSPLLEGFSTGEAYELRIWNHTTDIETPFHPTYIEGNDWYEIDGVSIIGAEATTDISSDFDQAISIQCYPNPSRTETFFELSLSEATAIKLSVYDLSGKQVARLVNDALRVGEHTLRVDVSTLAEGEYIYHVEGTTGIQSGKFVVVK